MARIPVESASASEIVVEGRRLLAFGGCNYLGLAHHPSVLRAVREGLETYGLSTTASRETTGDTISHDLLEAELAGFLQTQQCLVTPEGYSANMALGQALARGFRVAITDEKCHRSVSHAVAAAGLRVIAYPHLDVRGAASLAQQYSTEGVVILTDGVFAADGSVAPARSLLEALPQGKSLLVIDDCHGFCVLGRSGRGTADHHGLSGPGRPLDPRVIVTTTLAKGLGCYGGCVAGASSIVQLAQDIASVYRGTTPCPPAIIEGAREALRTVEREPVLIQRLRANADRLRRGLASLGINAAPTPAPIFTFIVADVPAMERVHQRMRDAGILAPLISYPGGPADRYFRLTVNASHTGEQIDRLLESLREAMSEERIDPSRAAAHAAVAPKASRTDASPGPLRLVSGTVDAPADPRPAMIGPWDVEVPRPRANPSTSP